MVHDSAPNATCSVIVPAYTLDRWDLLLDCVEGVMAQTVRPIELIMCIDHNEDLLARCRLQWPSATIGDGIRFKVIRNEIAHEEIHLGVHARVHGTRRRFGAGTARTCAAKECTADVLAFLDDDATPDPTWLEHLLAPYNDPGVVAVGGAPLPRYETGRPRWFPLNYDWVFGCAYAGLPTTRAPYPHLIGANMSVRREAFERLGGFNSIDFDDLDLCMRLGAAYSTSALVYEPEAVVRHFVPSGRVEWSYFWRRCLYVNREKVATFRAMGAAANMKAERKFVLTELPRQALADLRRLLTGDFFAISRVFAMFVGAAAAAFGHIQGRLDSRSA